MTLSFPSLSGPKLTLSSGHYIAVYSESSNDVLVSISMIHIDVLMLCRKFELIPTKIFQVMTILKN